MQISSRPRSPRKIIWKEYEEYKEYRTHNLVCRVDSSSIGRILGVTEGPAVGDPRWPAVADPTAAVRLAMIIPVAGHDWPWLAATGAAAAAAA